MHQHIQSAPINVCVFLLTLYVYIRDMLVLLAQEYEEAFKKEAEEDPRFNHKKARKEVASQRTLHIFVRAAIDCTQHQKKLRGCHE